MARVLVVSPHPDDEAIGCGGSLRLHADRGHRVEVVFLTSGEGGGHGLDPAATARRREGEAGRAAAILGIAACHFWRLEDGAVRVTAALVERLRAHLDRYRPERLYVPHPGEMHRDHRAAARLVRRAAAGVRGLEVLGFEVWTPLARVDEVVDVTAVIDRKVAAIRAHRSQCRVLAFDQAMRGLARYRGELLSWPEGEYAEVFARLEVAP